MVESITLYNQLNGADKVYKIDLAAVDGGFTVTGWNGRRGSTLKEQKKTNSPLPYAEAKPIYDALIKSKMKSGYRPGDDASTYIAAAVDARCEIGLHLLTPVNEADIERYLTDDTYFAQPKKDGERRPVMRRGNVVAGNRNGMAVALPKALMDALGKLPDETAIDCEQIGDHLYVFDALSVDGIDFRNSSALERIAAARTIVGALGDPGLISVVETATGTQAKREMYARLRAERQEGIVFKRGHSKYVPGYNDDQIKVKFYASATLQVASVHASKRSVAVQAFNDDGAVVPLGFVTIPANKAIPSQFEVIEVAYLYVVSRLCQPTFKGVRTDRSAADCVASQLKYRSDIAEGDAENDAQTLLAA